MSATRATGKRPTGGPAGTGRAGGRSEAHFNPFGPHHPAGAPLPLGAGDALARPIDLKVGEGKARPGGPTGFILGSEGMGYEQLYVPSGGSKAPLTPESIAAHQQFINRQFLLADMTET